MATQTIPYKRYLDGLPPERREAIERVWQTVRESMPAGYKEEIGPKFLTFKAEDEWYVSLANQKNYISLYLTPVYVFPELKAKLDSSGKKIKCGKGCVNFKRAEDLPLETIAEIVGTHDAESYKKHMRELREGARQKSREGRKKAASKTSR
ncbi:MAG TPA: DUF1801 domain-containing protein [Pyrinomonadaceae bacterium]|nr:DUF1801 domain-containing protein [Pyrinomonadaceae bacterium]